jgi:hypothetical protein
MREERTEEDGEKKSVAKRIVIASPPGRARQSSWIATARFTRLVMTRNAAPEKSGLVCGSSPS